MSHLTQLLHQCFGFSEFREGQEQTISQLLNGQSSLSIFPTGSGKSLCYQLTATQLPHLTLVVSPLLALMKDQLAFLDKHNVAAASIDSSLNGQEQIAVMNRVRSGDLKVLMISVERFKNERFRQFISSVPISMLVVDEAHCISEWGHNFRPDYLKLPSYQQQLKIPLVLLLTATATQAVKFDMADKFAIDSSHIIQTGFYRKNLDLAVLPVLANKKDCILLEQINQQKGAGIIYVTLQKTAEDVARYLQTHEINAKAYHAGLQNDARQTIQTDFMNGSVDIIVATIAFGMGIDKSNIRYVIHYDLPKSIENYSQEIGRAGRDGIHANCIVLANLDNVTTLENFVYGDTPELNSITRVIGDIGENTVNGRWEFSIFQLSKSSNIRQLTLKTLLVQLELMGVVEPRYTYFSDYRIKLKKTQEEIVGLFKEERAKFIKALFHYTNFKKVWGEIDFEAMTQSYPCERSRVLTALEYLTDLQVIELETKGVTELYHVDINKLNTPHLDDKLYHYFVEKEHKEIERIGNIIAFFEQESCLSRSLSQYFDDQSVSENCGHCSVCRGNIAKLNYSSNITLPQPNVLIDYLLNLKVVFDDKNERLTVALCCRFLSGISIPLFTQLKVKKITGFGAYEKVRYAELKAQVEQVSSQIFSR